MSRYLPAEWALPAIDKFNADFFTSGRLMIQECASCGHLQHPPEEACGECQSMEFKGREASGSGTIYSYIIPHHAPSPILADRVPYVIALVSLDDYPQIRVIGNVLNADPDKVAIGQKVRVTFEKVDDPHSEAELLLPQWELV